MDVRGKKPRRSLRRLFFTRFFLFNLLPLSLLALVVQVQYKNTINLQIKDRLTVQVREIEALFASERVTIERFLNFTAQDKSFIYYLSTLDANYLQETLQEKINRYNLKMIKVYTQAGQPFLIYNNGFVPVLGSENLTPMIMDELESQPTRNDVSFERASDKSSLMLSQIERISGLQGKTVGYIEATLPVDLARVGQIKRDTGAELVFFDERGQVQLSSLPNSLDNESLGKEFLKGQNSFFEFSLSSLPFAFISTPVSWGASEFLIGVGSSTFAAERSIRSVNYAIIFTYVCFIGFLFMMSYFFVSEFIQPVESLIRALDRMKATREIVYIENKSRTEVANLIDSFNELSQKSHEYENQLTEKVQLLEKANEKIQKTQSQLVQSAKLASLGELVAGIAHELNNPIGFIYSNIGHLKDYSQTLFNIVDHVPPSSELEKLKKEGDYEYIKGDFPKLIHSCEEGANRAKDIVIGLRNFSRADEKQVQAADLNQSIDSTLQLLAGEIKNRIKLVKDYGELPTIQCNVNQLKQVFMNILNNACQAIVGKGEIRLTTRHHQQDGVVEIAIADNGVGIPADKISKIFDPFYTTKEVGKGTGLGLSISYGIITSHGGEIFVQSREGIGSEFTIRLPVS